MMFMAFHAPKAHRLWLTALFAALLLAGGALLLL